MPVAYPSLHIFRLTQDMKRRNNASGRAPDGPVRPRIAPPRAWRLPPWRPRRTWSSTSPSHPSQDADSWSPQRYQLAGLSLLLFVDAGFLDLPSNDPLCLWMRESALFISIGYNARCLDDAAASPTLIRTTPVCLPPLHWRIARFLEWWWYRALASISISAGNDL